MNKQLHMHRYMCMYVCVHNYPIFGHDKPTSWCPATPLLFEDPGWQNWHLPWNLHPHWCVAETASAAGTKAIFYGPVGFIQLFLGYIIFRSWGSWSLRTFPFWNHQFYAGSWVPYVFVRGQPCSSTIIFVGIPEGFHGGFWDLYPGERWWK